MTKKELIKKEFEAHAEFEVKLHNLRIEYAIANSKFAIGDFIKTITGIFKLTSISYSMDNDEIKISYCGYKYHKNDDGKLIKTDNNIACFTNGITYKN